MAEPAKPNRKDSWGLITHTQSMKSGSEFIPKGGIKDSHGDPLAFKYYPPSSGGAMRKAYKCSSHVNCPVVVRVLLKGTTFAVECKLGVEHSKEEAAAKRKNATLTNAQAAKMKEAINQGTKPAALLSSWTSVVLDSDPTAQKRKEGGLEGSISSNIY